MAIDVAPVSRMMMTCFCINFLILVIMTYDSTKAEVRTSRHLSADFKPHQFNNQQKMALQQVIRTMMGFNKEVSPVGLRVPASEGGKSGSHPLPPNQQVMVPRYMHRLFERYRSGEQVDGQSEIPDTVRSIGPNLAIVNNGSLFVFNLTSVGEAETVLRAEIHIYRRRFKTSDPQPYDPGSTYVKAYELGPRILRERASFRLTESGHSGWNSFDVTTMVQSYASHHRNGATLRMLAVTFTDGQSNGTDDKSSGTDGQSTGTNGQPSGTLYLSKIMRKLSKPYLVVYSKENHSNRLDAKLDRLFSDSGDRTGDRDTVEKISWRWDYDNPLMSHGRSFSKRKHKVKKLVSTSGRGPRRLNITDEEMESFLDHDEATGNSSERAIQRNAFEEDEIGGVVRSKFYHAGVLPGEVMEMDDGGTGSGERSRMRRSVTDNEIPHDVTFISEPETVPEVRHNIPITNPGILRGRSRSGRKGAPSTPRPMADFGVTEDFSTKRRGKSGGGTPEGESLATLFPRLYYRHRHGGSVEGKGEAVRPVEAQGLCGKRKLEVDFEDIGWSDWIISPKSFEAHYCEGLCSYPIASRLRPTNHATIQSIVKAIGLQREVPSPCCIPASLSSVTLLYFDQNQNVVLKNYPDMTVRSCACR